MSNTPSTTQARWWAPLLAVLLLANVLPHQEAEALAMTVWGTDRVNVGFTQLPPTLHVGATWNGAEVLRVLVPLNAATFRTGDPSGFIAKASTDPTVRYAVEDPKIPLASDFDVEATLTLAGATGGYEPNDPDYGNQYGPRLIRADHVWHTWKGGPGSNVCALDTGVHYGHEDIEDAATGENWRSGIGFTARFDTRLPTDPMDDNGHGTAVASIAAARMGNGKGISGVANVGLYAAKVLDSSNSGYPGDLAAGILWCLENAGPRVVLLMSLGVAQQLSVNGVLVPTEGIMKPVHEAIKYARSRGALPIAAAGNAGANCASGDCVDFPARYPEVIAVACVDQQANVCPSSSLGPSLDIAAPGANIRTAYSTTSTRYRTLGGDVGMTSLAAPHVAGAAALIWSAHTSCSASSIETVLLAKAKDLGASGWDGTYGVGLLDAKAAYDASSCGGDGRLLDANIVQPIRPREVYMAN